MAAHRVLITDYAWPDLDVERSVLKEIDAELIAASNADPATIGELASDVDAILVCWAPLRQATLEHARRCRVVARLGIGLDNIDVDYCTERGIAVTNVPDYCMTEVAEHTVASIVALGRQIPYFHLDTKHGVYELGAQPVPARIAGQTLGIVGWGNIGAAVGERALALGMRVLAYNRTPRGGPDGVTFVDLDTVLCESDYVSLHVALTSATRHLIAAPQLRQMKPGAYLINTARGGLIDHAALAAGLDAGHLGGAALDVQDPEPPDLSSPPFNHPRCVVTPHASFLSPQSLIELRTRAARQVATFLTGGVPEHIVNR